MHVTEFQVNMRFRGEYKHTVDAKGRVSLPAKFRKALPEEIVVVPSVGGALSVFSDEAFDAWVDSFFPAKEDGTSGFDPRNKQDVKLRRMLNASAESVPVDSAGRIMLSADKRSKAGIVKDVRIIGNDDHIEIWNAESFEDELDSFNLEDYMV